jgi:hypothetical protein
MLPVMSLMAYFEALSGNNLLPLPQTIGQRDEFNQNLGQCIAVNEHLTVRLVT